MLNVECPNCHGQDAYCMFCDGQGTVTESQCNESLRQWDEPEPPVNDDGFYPAADEAGS